MRFQYHRYVCPECKERFRSHREDAIFCGPRCKMRYHRRIQRYVKACKRAGWEV